MPTASPAWPTLPLADWADTLATLHMWTQVVGKIRLAQTPLVSQFWNVPLYVSARGLTASAMPPPYTRFHCPNRKAFPDAGGFLFYGPIAAEVVDRNTETIAFCPPMMANLSRLGRRIHLHFSA